MSRKIALQLLPALFASCLFIGCASPRATPPVRISPIKLDGLFYETAAGRTPIPVIPFARTTNGPGQQAETKMSDGRVVKIFLKPDGNDFTIRMTAMPDTGIIKWGLAVEAAPDEYFTGLMERVVDGPQQQSWATNLTAALNLRGQTVDMIVKPTLSVYAPFYISSRGYAVLVKGTWPGRFDFCAGVSNQVRIEFEGPSFEAKIYTADHPAALVRAHALDAGPPFLPPKWMYGTWRWRDEHTQRTNYYDGTPVTGPFNSEFMEDVLLMKAYGIPLGVYWIDRPWGPGRLGYDDFEIDSNRLPNFAESVKWLNAQDVQMMLWIGPFFQGQMETNALAKGWTLAGAGQQPAKNNYPLVDFTNPDAKKYWQDGVARLLKLGVAGFKMDRSEEDIPESGPYRVFDGRSIRENRNAYPVMYLQAAYDVAREYRTNDDFVCMPRAAYTGSSAFGVFWGGDIGGTEYGLRAEIIAVQRAAVMGYPNWGSDTCGYNQQSADTEVCGRWLAFSCFTPIMEVGPTQNRAFWDFHTPPYYDRGIDRHLAALCAVAHPAGRLQFRPGQTRPRDRDADCPPVVPGRSPGARCVVELVDVSLRSGPVGFSGLAKEPADAGGLSAVRPPMARCVATGKNIRRRPEHHRQREPAPNTHLCPRGREARTR